MKKILLLGAGLSSSTLIQYLLNQSQESNWFLILGDQDIELVRKKINGHPNARAIAFEISDTEFLMNLIKESDLVISMLPAKFHPIIAQECLNQSKHLVTASYISAEIMEMDQEARAKDLIFLNEAGLDPGIDHMSAMKVIHRIQKEGGKMLSFKSSTGGLVAPESDNNPWNYKFTWNPRNVVLAGQGVSQYIVNGRYKYIPYHQLFSRVEETEVPGYGKFEIYPNRDSLKYRSLYGLEDIPTMFRGTIRRPGFCAAWDVFVQLGMTSDEFTIPNSNEMTHRQFINSFLGYDPIKPVELKVCEYLNFDMNSDVMTKLIYTGIFEETLIEKANQTPAQILQSLLEKKWKLEEHDIDMIVMQHQFEYEIGGQRKKITSSMIVKGENQVHTAMSITVGTPVAIAVKMILNGDFTQTGVIAPVHPAVYEPILTELENVGIHFIEEESDL
jgi:saccharopine dehydrogenase-like NADP-dependent oxidoreductase